MSSMVFTFSVLVGYNVWLISEERYCILETFDFGWSCILLWIFKDHLETPAGFTAVHPGWLHKPSYFLELSKYL